MDLATIEVPVEEAERRLREYQERLKLERSAEDEALAAAYRAAKRGLPILQLSKCIEAGGFFGQSCRPKIAVVSAAAKRCWVRSAGNGLIYTDEDRWVSISNRTALVGRHHVLVPHVERPAGVAMFCHAAGTIVPSIPPRFRPRRNRLHLFHILWEVERWNQVPPRDPALIKHIRGDLWSVHATWDLTELERAVLVQ